MRRALLVVASLLALTGAPLAADEGMWTFNGFPFERFAKAHGVAPSQQLLDHLRLSALRWGQGGSASFVSADGLILTNQHVAARCIEQLSTPERDLTRDGFVAAGLEDEKSCPGLEVNLLESIERVTARIRAVERAGLGAEAIAAARKAEMAAIEKECSDEKAERRCDVITLYQGGEYDLYRFRRFTDVRLVFAPEAQLAHFGGDADNFEYPRYAGDFALARAWVDGRPHRPQHFLRWSREGVRDGHVTFLIGNPGSTGRLQTMAQLEFLRDVVYPQRLAALEHLRARLFDYAARGPEQARQAFTDLYGVENSIKATSGFLSGLLDAELMKAKAEQERRLRAAVAADPALAAEVGDAWGEIERALAVERELLPRDLALALSGGRLAGFAQTLLRLAEELPKPSGERLREYRDTALPGLYQRLYSRVPIYPEYEIFRLGVALRTATVQLGPVHATTRKALGDETPEEVAARALPKTKIADIQKRRALAASGKVGIANDRDPLLELMGTFEPLAREVRNRLEREVEAVIDLAGARIAAAYFATAGGETYPDATSSLRITYAPVAGYEEEGRTLPWATRLGGYFERSARVGGRPPFDLPPALAAAREKVDRQVPIVFVSTHDIIGGNSGSPVVNRLGELVGVVFDGNLQNLPNRFLYTDRQARALSVDSRGMLEILRRVYPAAHLVEELEHGRR